MESAKEITSELELSHGPQLAPPPTDEALEVEVKPLSKNAMKRAAKAQRLTSRKIERRAKEKETKKRKRAEKKAASELDNTEQLQESQRRAAKKRKIDFGGTVVIDLGFDDMMNDKEIISLSSQLGYTHSCNRLASFPFSLVFTSLNGRTYQRLESLGDASYTRWSSTIWSPEGYESLWAEQSSPFDSEAISSEPSTAAIVLDKTVSNHPRSAKTSFVYLTADAEDELIELKSEETYIIGGIVDHNRYKNLCLNRAKESGIRTAKLPIGRYLASLPTRKVLTVNQVFEILIKWVETKDWEEALYSVIPHRKFKQVEKSKTDTVINTADIEDGVDGVVDEELELTGSN